MAATTEFSSGSGSVTATGESNGLLLNLRKRNQALVVLGVSGTFTSLVLAVKGRIAGQTVFYPVFGWSIAGSPVDATALAPSDSTATRWVFDTTGLDAIEVYAVSGTPTAVTVEATELSGQAQPVVNTTLGSQVSVASAGSINDANGNELIKVPSAVSSAVNEVTVANAAAGASPSVAATGGDTNVSVKLTAKGTGVVEVTEIGGLGGVRKIVASTVTTAGDATFTVAQLKGGLILRDPTGASRADLLPTGTNFCGGLPGYATGAGFEFVIKNDADAAEVITVTTNTGVTLVGDMAIGQNELKRFVAIVTGANTYTCYALGSVAHNT
jgi:hypothetical protein